MSPAAYIFLLFCVLSPAHLQAAQLGSNGGVENDGEIPVKIQLFYEGGEYEWQELARDSYLPFPPNIVSVRVIEASNPYYDIHPAERIFRVVVTHPDGSQESLRQPGDQVVIIPDFRMSDKNRVKPFVIENRP